MLTITHYIVRFLRDYILEFNDLSQSERIILRIK